MLRSRNLILILTIWLSYSSFSQSLSDSLAKFKIYNYPSKNELDSLFYSPKDILLSKLITDDISADFSNIQDLKWVQQIAIKNKVILIGETHYSTFIQNLRNRILFAINQSDYYPLVILENAYSLTPFVNHFLTMSDDGKASDYFKKSISKFTTNVEDSIFYEHIRRWNKTHSNKKIEVGFTDMEWDSKTTLDEILKPYFAKLPVRKESLDSLFNLGLTEGFLSGIEPLMKKANESKLQGDYSFINVRYIQNVLSNLKYTFFSLGHSFDFYRQKGIIHNLTNDSVFGKIFKSSKVLMHGGGQHMATHYQFPFGGNFLTEGSYLSYEFKQTVGKTHSIMIEGIAFQLGEMSKIDMSKTFAGQQYKSILSRMKKAYNAGFLKADKPYFAFDTRDAFTDLIVHHSYKENATAFYVNEINWVNLKKRSSLRNGYLEMISERQDNVKKYDSYVYIPFSPVTILRVNK